MLANNLHQYIPIGLHHEWAGYGWQRFSMGEHWANGKRHWRTILPTGGAGDRRWCFWEVTESHRWFLMSGSDSCHQDWAMFPAPGILTFSGTIGKIKLKFTFDNSILISGTIEGGRTQVQSIVGAGTWLRSWYYSGMWRTPSIREPYNSTTAFTSKRIPGPNRQNSYEFQVSNRPLSIERR